ncbi:MAG: hypothetical protein IIX03_01340 [Paludibacteraceae bacterium]|nr:hypothetical protein [Paludibacteraceae bacterium]
MNRYSKITEKFPREFVLLQGTGCKWRQCTFCDYHTDVSDDPFEVNRQVLEQVTGEYGVLDVINSGSAFELDDRTIELLRRIIVEKKIHTLWCEMHWMYRNRLEQFAQRILDGVSNSQLSIKFRCGVETFDHELRKRWNKGVPEGVTAEEVARYFQGVCLLCCTEGETRERIVRDIELARKHFEYFSVNVFCNNTTKIKRDQALVDWFVSEVYPTIKDDPRIEVLIDNTDLGVG